MFCEQIIAVCSGIHTKRKNALRYKIQNFLMLNMVVHKLTTRL
jgi:hypothetical protein